MSRSSAGDQPVRASLRVDVQRRPAPPVALVRAAGELDIATVAGLQSALDGLLDDGYCALNIDVSEVAFCDVAGLNMLLRTRAAAVAAGGHLVVRGMCPTLRMMLHVLHLEHAFQPIHRNGEHAADQA